MLHTLIASNHSTNANNNNSSNISHALTLDAQAATLVKHLVPLPEIPFQHRNVVYCFMINGETENQFIQEATLRAKMYNYVQTTLPSQNVILPCYSIYRRVCDNKLFTMNGCVPSSDSPTFIQFVSMLQHLYKHKSFIHSKLDNNTVRDWSIVSFRGAKLYTKKCDTRPPFPGNPFMLLSLCKWRKRMDRDVIKYLQRVTQWKLSACMYDHLYENELHMYKLLMSKQKEELQKCIYKTLKEYNQYVITKRDFEVYTKLIQYSRELTK